MDSYLHWKGSRHEVPGSNLSACRLFVTGLVVCAPMPVQSTWELEEIGRTPSPASSVAFLALKGRYCTCLHRGYRDAVQTPHRGRETRNEAGQTGDQRGPTADHWSLTADCGFQ